MMGSNRGSLDNNLQFKNHSITSDLSCANITDQFSINNEKAKLKYPIGLMSAPEMNLLNNNFARKAGSNYWTGSPYNFTGSAAFKYYVYSDGSFSYNNVATTYGVRPGTMYSEGDGSKKNPYIVDMDMIN